MGSHIYAIAKPQNPYHRTRIGLDYYDESADAARREEYYAPVVDVFTQTDGVKIFETLHHLLEKTHHPIDDLPADDLYGEVCLLYTSPSPRDRTRSRMPSSA